jgi:hypothetical protein
MAGAEAEAAGHVSIWLLLPDLNNPFLPLVMTIDLDDPG